MHLPSGRRTTDTRSTIRLAPLIAALAGLLTAGPAAAQFGKNKVQYETFDFRVLQTEHFDVHYYPEFESAAFDAARMAERAYVRLSKVFRHDWTERKPLVLYASQSDFQQTNIFRFHLSEGIQGVTEGLRDRIVLFFPSAYPEFDHTLTHELVHAFQYDIMRRGALSQGSNPFAFRPPLWFMEGMAEYLSAGRIDPQTAMWLRDASLSGYLTTLDELSRVHDIRVYRFGQAIFYYVGTRYGDQKIGEIMQKAPLLGTEEAFEAAIGRTLDELSEEWLEAVRTTYLPQVLRHPAADQAAVRLTDHVEDDAAINVGPALSPDGSRMAFISDRDYFNDLYLADAEDGGRADKVVQGERTESFESLRFLRAGTSFSPDGERLAFSSKVGEQDALYVMRVEDGKIVASHRFGLEGVETPSWSPDGETLVFTGLEGGVSDLFVVGVDGEGFRRLTDDRYAQRDPVWSPDGSRIAFTTDFGPGTDFDLLAYGEYQIGIYRLDDGSIDYLPDQAGKNINPQWGPDGRTLAFVSDRTGIPNVFLHDLETGLTYQLTDLLTGVSGVIESSPALAWSRDGRRMVFSAFSDGGWDLYRVDDPLSRVGEPYRPPEREAFDLAERSLAAPGVVFGKGRAVRPDADRDDEAGEPSRAVGRSDPIAAYLGGRRRGEGDGPPPWRVPSFREPVDVATLLADPTIGLPRDTSGYRRRDYQVRFQPDMISQPQVGFVTGLGAVGASQLAFSDLLGDHNLFVAASVYGSVSDSDLFFTYANLKRRLNWGATAFQYRSDFAPLAVRTVDSDLLLFRSDVYRGGQVFAAYPFSRFRRLEFGGTVTHVDRRIARFDLFAASPEIEEDLPNEAFVAPSVAYVFDTAFYGSTGPIGGSRQRLEVQRAFGDRDYVQVYGDLRRYLFFRKRYTIALRALYLGTFGQSDENLRFQSIGGPTLLRGFDFRDDALVGTTVGLVNLEFRFPLVERPRLGSSSLPPLRAALWADVGFASCGDERCLHQTEDGERRPFRFSTSEDGGPLGFRLVDARGSFGAGVRMNLFGFAVVRLDRAQPTDFASLRWGDGRWVFTLAPEF